MKKVSVIIPAYNKAALTAEAVRSVLDQTYDDIEIIVVDDGSTDGTVDSLDLFIYSDMINYIYQHNRGCCSARNVGIREATGEYIALLDCDDVYYPEKIAKSVEFLKENPDCGFVSTDAYLIDINDKTISVYSESRQKRERFIFNNTICNSTVVVRKSCFEKVGLFDEEIFIPADWDMWIRLAEQYKACYIDEKLTGYRISENYSQSHQRQALKENLYAIKKMFKRNKGILRVFKCKCYISVYLGALVRLLRGK